MLCSFLSAAERPYTENCDGISERFPQAGGAKGKPNRRRPSHAGSRSHDDLNSTEVCGLASGRVYQGQECDPFGPGLRGEKAQFRGAALLGQRVLRLDRRSRRSGDKGVHPETGTRRQPPRSNESVALIVHLQVAQQKLGPRQRPQKPLRAAHFLKPPALPGDTYLDAHRS